MGYALTLDSNPDAEVVWCYCCEEFTPHEVFPGDEDTPTYYQCNCGCQLEEGEDEIIRPEDKGENSTNLGYTHSA